MTERRILLVESDVLVRHPLAEYLRECGYLVIEAANVPEARLIADQYRIDTHPGNVIDIVLADIDTQGENGFALAEWIRGRYPHMEILLAGTVASAVAKAGHLCAEGRAITKPYDHAHVLDRIKRLRAARDRAT